MRLVMVAVGERMPVWVDQAYKEYAKRLSRECTLQLAEVTPSKHRKSGDINRAVADEGKRIMTALPKHCFTIAMDERGALWNTQQLASQLREWLQSGSDVAFMIGGADGLSDECKSRAQCLWSLSPLTLPHALVRVVLAEQLYRAWTVVAGHPYHRI